MACHKEFDCSQILSPCTTGDYIVFWVRFDLLLAQALS